MKFLDEQIQRVEGLHKGIEETTDLTVLRSKKLLYELEKEKFEAQRDAMQLGRPTIEAESVHFRFMRSMGFEPHSFSSTVDDSSGWVDCKTILDRLGFPEKYCERTVTGLAICDIGDLPKPDVILSDGGGCDGDRESRRCIGDWFNIPVFYIDVSLNEDDKPDLANLNYITDQLGEFIEWAEKKLPGVKYDKDKHIEMLESDAIGTKYRKEIYQLVKHVPCPLSPKDARHKRLFGLEPSRYPNMQKAIEFLRMSRDELGERVASGQGPYPEERLRLLWAGQFPDSDVLDPGDLLLERKVALPMTLHGTTNRMIGLRCAPPFGEVSEYGIKLSPLQEEARVLDNCSWGGAGKRWVNSTLDLARDIGAHGIINYLLIGCTPMRSMGSVVAERAEKELGIPVLNLEGRKMDKDYMSQERFEKILSFFIDKCFDWAGK